MRKAEVRERRALIVAREIEEASRDAFRAGWRKGRSHGIAYGLAVAAFVTLVLWAAWVSR